MARGKTPSQDLTTLQMALVGYELERQRIDDKIRELKALLGGKRAPAAPASGAAQPGEAPRKRNLSAAARNRIAMAQKRRWAEHRKKAAAAAKTSKKPAKAEAPQA